jgi:hypothetical protein
MACMKPKRRRVWWVLAAGLVVGAALLATGPFRREVSVTLDGRVHPVPVPIPHLTTAASNGHASLIVLGDGDLAEIVGSEDARALGWVTQSQMGSHYVLTSDTHSASITRRQWGAAFIVRIEIEVTKN